MGNPTKLFYEASSGDYDKYMMKTGHYLAQKKTIKKLYSKIKEPILDLACGSGYIVSLLTKDFKKISANDFSSTMIELARNNQGEKAETINFTHDNAEKLNSQTKKINTIICCNLFFYIKHKNIALKRWKSLLNKNGHLIICEEFPFKKPHKGTMNQHANKLMRIVNPITIEKIIELTEKNGFKLITKKKTVIDKEHSLFGLVFKQQD